MHLVEDIHAVLTANRRVRKLVLKLVNVADAAVAGSVQLDDISGFVVGYLAAAFALKAGISACRVLAVQRHCEYLRAGGLAGAAASGEQVCVGVLPLAIWFFSVVTISGWEITSSNVLGRYFLYNARYTAAPPF